MRRKWTIGLVLLGCLNPATLLATEIKLSVKTFVPGTQVPPGNQSAITGVALSPDDTLLYAAYWTDHHSACPVEVRSALPPYAVIDNTSMVYDHNHGDVVVSPDGRYVFTTGYYTGDVSRFDTQNSYARNSRDLGSWASAIWMTPDGGGLLAGFNQWSGSPACNASLALFDVADGAFTLTGSVSLGHPLPGAGKAAFSSDGNYAYVATGPSTTEGHALLEISLPDAGDPVVVRSAIPPGADNLYGVVRVGEDLYVAAREDKKIYVVSRDTFVNSDEISLDYSPWNIALHPDGQHLFVLFGDEGVVSVMDLGTNTMVDSIELDNFGAIDIEFTADGNTAFVSHNYHAAGGITVLNVPEPATLVLLVLGGLAVIRRRRP